MNSSNTIWGIKPLRQQLLEIDNCTKEFNPTDEEDQPWKREDGSPYLIICSMAQMCPECVDRLACCLEWAEDLEQNYAGSNVPTNSNSNTPSA